MTLDSLSCGCGADGFHILDLQTGHDFHVYPTGGARLGCNRRRVHRTAFESVAWSPDSRTVAFSCVTGIHRLLGYLLRPAWYPGPRAPRHTRARTCPEC